MGRKTSNGKSPVKVSELHRAKSSRSRVGTSVIRTDVLVVGAGPAGIAAAKTLATSGARVILIDRAKRLVSKNFLEVLADIAPDAVAQARAAGGLSQEYSSE